MLNRVNHMNLPSILIAASLLVVALPATADHPWAFADDLIPGVVEEYYDEAGHLVYERGIEPTNPELAYVKHHYLYRDSNEAKPDGKGPGGGGGPGPGTDCSSTKFALTGHYWTAPYSASASSYANLLDQAAEAWDAATGANIFGSISGGSQATAGVQDFVNQMDWTSLGASTTVAVTTTWYYRSSGEAVESDAQYNTYYNWATNGDPNAMDVLHVATHEIGHTFGLDHPNGPSSQIGCLTMYAYVGNGDTHGRTLGDGDILGIQDLYGA